MISTSDGETYEDATAHALGVPQPVTASSSTPSRMPRQAPTEPAGAFKSEQGTQVAGDLGVTKGEYEGSGVNWMIGTKNKLKDIESLRTKDRFNIQVPPNHPEIEKYLKDNPDIDYHRLYSPEGPYLLHPPAQVGSLEGMTQVASNDPKKLYIIRHGSTDMNGESNVSTDRIRGWKDVPLNDEGRQDAEKAGQKLAQMESPTVMHHSDLDRASETAGIISKHIDTPTTASRDLRPWDLGELTGKTTKEAIPQIEDYVKNKPDQAVPKGESFNEFKERAFKGIYSALNSGDSPVAIVTHHRLERLLEAWDKKGQPADHSIDIDTFTQKGDPPGGIKEMMIHQPDKQPDMVQKTIRATIQHFKNAFMEGPNLMKDFMEGKVTSEDETAIRRALNVGWKTTPIAPRGLPMKAENTPDNAAFDELATWYKINPELSPGFAFERAGKIPPVDMTNLKQESENIVHRNYDLKESLKELGYDLNTIKDRFISKDNKNPLSKAAGIDDVESRVTEAIVRQKNKEMAKKAKIMKY